VNSRAKSLKAWSRAHQRVLASGGVLRIPKNSRFPHPREAGALPTTTWPVGQLADYAIEFELGAAPLLVREFTDRYEAFVIGAQLTSQIVGLVESNPALALFLAGALLGAVVGAGLSNSRQGVILGAGVGILTAAILNASLKRDTA
jgi:hypothetical protein